MKALVVVLLALLPSSAWANGAYSHVHISQLAVQELPEGPLKALLSDPYFVAMYEAGSMFPDSGYAVGDDYGERAHWAPFHNAFIHHIQETYGPDYDSVEARERIAFLLGMMSHGLTDQIYDTTILERALELDGNRDKEFDRLADYFIIVDELIDVTTQAWGPYEEVSQVFDTRRSYTVSPATLEEGMNAMQSVMFFQQTLAWGGEYLIAWQTYPWLGTHIYNPDAPGSLPHLAILVATHWQVIWKRLYGTDSLDTDLLIASIPRDGAVNVPIDSSESEAYSRIGLVFGYGIRRSQAAPLVRLLDPNGDPVSYTMRSPYNGETRNFLMIDPDAPLLHNTLYTVEIGAGVENLDGDTSTQPYSFTFTTRCAPDKLVDCPPLPEPLVTGDVPTSTPQRPRPQVEPQPEPLPDTAPAPDTTPTRDTTPERDTAQPEASSHDDGCGCTLAHTPSRGPQTLLWLLLGGVILWRTRR